jgi:uncharacterized protein
MLIDLLIVQILLGAFDTLYHHEMKEQLPYRPGAALELRIHGWRELVYAVITLGLAWFTLGGWFAPAMSVLFLIEIGLTLWDFAVEDRTRKLPLSERITHTILAINGGVFLALLAGTLLQWWTLPTEIGVVSHGWRSWFLTAAVAGLVAWGVRDLYAAYTLARMPRAVADTDWGPNRLRVLVTGATGFIGRKLVWTLLDQGHRVTAVSRDVSRAWALFDGGAQVLESAAELDNDTEFDLIVNLAGEPVVGLPWTVKRKESMLRSRVMATQELVGFVARASHKPALMISGSAVGYYGNRDDAPLTEQDEAQTIFMSQLCEKWERAAAGAEDHGVRVCRLRLGLVLGWGGAFPMLVAPHLLGLGSRIGDGRQWISWVHVDDVVRAIAFLARSKDARGPYNLTTPCAMRQGAIAHEIAGAYHRPQWLVMPSALLEGVLGEMAQLFTRGQRVVPARLTAAGFRFRYGNFTAALRRFKEVA